MAMRWAEAWLVHFLGRWVQGTRDEERGDPNPGLNSISCRSKHFRMTGFALPQTSRRAIDGHLSTFGLCRLTSGEPRHASVTPAAPEWFTWQ
jgi:hypothetical protein